MLYPSFMNCSFPYFTLCAFPSPRPSTTSPIPLAPLSYCIPFQAQTSISSPLFFHNWLKDVCRARCPLRMDRIRMGQFSLGWDGMSWFR